MDNEKLNEILELKEEDHIEAEIAYRCTYCHNPSIVFAEIEEAKKHTKRCLFNPSAKSCVQCKHLKIIEQPPYPRFEKTYQSAETYHAFGAYKTPYCMKKDIDINEYLLFDNHDECFEFCNDEPVTVEQTDEFKKYVELIESDDISSERITKEELEELIKQEEEWKY